jgi:hypothetical protein
MLEVLPPAIMTGYGFLVGEPWNHDANNRPRFMALVELDKQFYEALGPMTIKDFKELTRDAVMAGIQTEAKC